MLQIYLVGVIITMSQLLKVAKNREIFMQNIKRNYKDTVFCDLFSDKEILEKCPPLKGYAALVGYVREYQRQKLSLPEAIDKATGWCIREEYLKAYLLKKRS